jgi:hypothetical protein
MSKPLLLTIEVDDKGTAKIKKFQKALGKADKKAGKWKKSLKTLGLGAVAMGGAVAGAAAKLTMYAGAAVAGAALAATAALTIGFKKAIDAASEMQETTGKFEVVFKNTMYQASQYLKDLTENYAMAEVEAKGFLAGFQDLLVPMGMAETQAANLSGEMTKLAADLGSFNNMETVEVAEKLRAAMVGEYDAVRSLGIVLSAATVEQRALKMGLAETAKELTAADKAQAAYKMILEGSKAAVGDMARTSGSYANQMKRLHANQKDFMVLVGDKLLPVATKIVTAFNDWYKANEGLVQSKIDEVMGYLLETGKELYETMVPMVQQARAWFETNKEWLALGVVTTFKLLVGVVAAIAKGFEVMGVGLGVFAAKMVDFVQVGAMRDLKQAWDDLKKGFNFVWNNILDVMDRAGQRIMAWVDKVAGYFKKIKNFVLNLKVKASPEMPFSAGLDRAENKIGTWARNVSQLSPEVVVKIQDDWNEKKNKFQEHLLNMRTELAGIGGKAGSAWSIHRNVLRGQIKYAEKRLQELAVEQKNRNMIAQSMGYNQPAPQAASAPASTAAAAPASGRAVVQNISFQPTFMLSDAMAGGRAVEAMQRAGMRLGVAGR